MCSAHTFYHAVDFQSVVEHKWLLVVCKRKMREANVCSSVSDDDDFDDDDDVCNSVNRNNCLFLKKKNKDFIGTFSRSFGFEKGIQFLIPMSRCGCCLLACNAPHIVILISYNAHYNKTNRKKTTEGEKKTLLWQREN